MQICAKRAQAAQGIMFPSNSGSKPHKAYAWKPDAPEINGAFCSCQAFIFGRSKIAKSEGASPQEVTFVCKHLQQVFDSYCGWHQTTEAEYRFDRTCPKCGGEVIDTDDELIPTDTTGAVNDLRAMLAEINGEEPPEPIVGDKEFTIEYDMIHSFVGTVMAKNQAEADDKWADLHQSGTAKEVNIESRVVNVFKTPPEPPPPAKKATHARKAPTTVTKPDLKATATAAADLAATVAPRRKRTA